MSIENVELDNDFVVYDSLDINTEEEQVGNCNGKEVTINNRASKDNKINSSNKINDSFKNLEIINTSLKNNQANNLKKYKYTKTFNNNSVRARIVPCGVRYDGELSVNVEADTDGNQSAGVEFGIKDKDTNITGSVSGEFERDSDGNTNGKVKGKVSIPF